MRLDLRCVCRTQCLLQAFRVVFSSPSVSCPLTVTEGDLRVAQESERGAVRGEAPRSAGCEGLRRSAVCCS